MDIVKVVTLWIFSITAHAQKFGLCESCVSVGTPERTQTALLQLTAYHERRASLEHSPWQRCEQTARLFQSRPEWQRCPTSFREDTAPAASSAQYSYDISTSVHSNLAKGCMAAAHPFTQSYNWKADVLPLKLFLPMAGSGPLSNAWFPGRVQSMKQWHAYTRLTALFPGLPGWAGNRMVKPIWILLKQEWQWHQLGHTQVCISLQTDNQASTPPLSFFTGRMPFLPPNQQHQSTETVNGINSSVQSAKIGIHSA